MPQEKFQEPKPSKKEIDKAVNKAEGEMDEYYKSQFTTKPTKEHIDAVLKDVAKQSGENYEPCDPAISKQEIIEKYKKDGWQLIYEIRGRVNTDLYYEEGKETKVIGLGDSEFLVFQRDIEEDEEDE